jgi:hypothetical protein
VHALKVSCTYIDFKSCQYGVDLRVVCSVCGLMLYWLCFVACRGWVTESQLKKGYGASLRDNLACLVEGLYVELLEGQ